MRAIVVWCGAAIGFAFSLPAIPAIAQDVRQLPPHVHGSSHLGIAVAGKQLSMELHSPGNDIVGFEFVPSTDAQRAAVNTATAQLKDPLGLFGFPAAAQCTVQKADVVLAEEEEGADDAPPAPGAAPAPVTPAPAGPAAPRHSEFQVTYELTCNNGAAIGNLAFGPFFQKFANAQEVQVDIVGAKNAFSFTVPRASPNPTTRGMF